MAWDSDGTDGRRLYNATFAPLNGSAGPFTICGWFRSDSTTQTDKYLFQAHQLNVANQQWAVIYEYVNNTVEFFADGFTGTDPRTSSGLTVADTSWHHLAYRKGASGASTWDKFLDGTKTAISASIDFTLPSTLNDFTVLGAAAGTTPTFANSPNGKIGPVAIWNVSLSDDEVASLARRQSASRIRPGSQVAYFEMLGRSPEPELSGAALALTNTDCTVADHPPLAPAFGFLGGWQGGFTAAAAAVKRFLSLLNVGT